MSSCSLCYFQQEMSKLRWYSYVLCTSVKKCVPMSTKEYFKSFRYNISLSNKRFQLVFNVFRTFSEDDIWQDHHLISIGENFKEIILDYICCCDRITETTSPNLHEIIFCSSITVTAAATAVQRAVKDVDISCVRNKSRELFVLPHCTPSPSIWLSVWHMRCRVSRCIDVTAAVISFSVVSFESSNARWEMMFNFTWEKS